MTAGDRAGRDPNASIKRALGELGAHVRGAFDDAGVARYGAFRVLQLVATGGVAEVFAAARDGESDDGDALRYAVKVLKPGVEGEEVLKRFAREREILAELAHRSIVQIIDSGVTADGRPWIAMPLIDGPPITVAADERRLTLDARIALFADALAAVAAAHDAGVLHRDLKPANILVEGADGRLVPRIIDFGVARAMDGRHVRLTPESIAHRLGTPDYMAPEQWEYGIGACEKPSDVFALGIVLGELACGVLPRDGAPVKSRGQRPAPPLAPSKALLGLAATDAARARDLAARRGFADVDACARAIAARIDPIFVKATAAEAPARYADAGAMRAMLARA